jgi:hypothetical protein
MRTTDVPSGSPLLPGAVDPLVHPPQPPQAPPTSGSRLPSEAARRRRKPAGINDHTA